jgi:hypothetical protein
MARAQAQYLRIFDASSTYQRWQSYYVGTAVTWSGAAWDYQQFDCDGITSGQSGSDGSMGVTLPATQYVINAIERALRDAQLMEILLYEFDPTLNNATPQAGQSLVATFVGEVVSASGGLSSLSVALGSSLSPIGAQATRYYTTEIIGVPCQL